MFKFQKKCSINTLFEINVTDYPNCNQAVLIDIKDGKGKLKWVQAKNNNTYYRYLTLNGKPIPSAKEPFGYNGKSFASNNFGIEKNKL